MVAGPKGSMVLEVLYKIRVICKDKVNEGGILICSFVGWGLDKLCEVVFIYAVEKLIFISAPTAFSFPINTFVVEITYKKEFVLLFGG